MGITIFRGLDVAAANAARNLKSLATSAAAAGKELESATTIVGRAAAAAGEAQRSMVSAAAAAESSSASVSRHSQAAAAAAEEAERAVVRFASQAEAEAAEKAGHIHKYWQAVGAQLDEVASDVRQGLDGLTSDVNDRIDKLIEVLGGENAGFVEMLNRVKDGLISTQQLIDLFGQQTVVVGGKVRTLADLLTDLGPTAAETAGALAKLKDQVDGMDLDGLEKRLRDHYSEYSKYWAALIEQFKKGKLTADELERELRRFRELHQELKDSGGDVLLQELLDGLQAGRFGR